MKRDRLLLAAFVLSGTAALGYELLWTRLLALALGSESLGMLGALSGFFGGLALGSWRLHRRARTARDPARLFAVLEAVAAVYALLSPVLLYFLARRLPPLLGPAAGDNDTALALVLSLLTATLVLLPATVPMGATLAALVEARRRTAHGEAAGYGLGRLYAANTAGATCGVLVTVYLVLPRLGMQAGAAVLSGFGLTAAALALLWSRQGEPPPPAKKAGKKGKKDRRQEAQAPEGRRWLHGALALTGLAGVGLEVAGVQILAQNMENTVYTFANALAVYLVGTATGAWLYSRRADRAASRRRTTTSGLLLAQAASVLFAAFILAASPRLLEALAPSGSSYPREIVAEMLTAAAVFVAPTVVMGALFSHLMAPLEEGGVGRAYALNTLGGTLAPFLFGLGLIRPLGYAPALYLAGAIYLALAFSALSAGHPRRPRWALAGLVVLFAGFAAPRSMLLVEVPSGWKVVRRDPGLLGLVVVTEEEGSTLPGRRLNRRLQVNRHFRMGGSSAFGEQRMGHIALLFAPRAERALFLGLGTGVTLSAVRDFPLRHVDAVELVPEVLDALPLFGHVNEGVVDLPKVSFHAADARRFVAAAAEPYDVVVGDLFYPGRDGAGSLYAREHFAAIAERLAPGGIYAQWLPLYQFDVPNLKTVVRTFLDVYPEAHSFLGIYNALTPALVLLGRTSADDGPWLTIEELEERLRAPVYDGLLMTDPHDLMGAYMLDRPALGAFAGDGPLNTDLHPRILFDAPKNAYDYENRQDVKWEALAALLPLRTPCPEGFLGGDASRLRSFRSGTRRFSEAITAYLQGEILRLESGGGLPLPDRALESYFAAYEEEPGFEAAAGMLYSIALALPPPQAEPIFQRMLARDDTRPETWEHYVNYLAAAGAPPDVVADADRRARAALGLAPPGGTPALSSRSGHLSQD